MTDQQPRIADPGRDQAAGLSAAPLRHADASPADAALDQILGLHEAPALPPGLTARILRDVPLRPQLAMPGYDSAASVAIAPMRAGAQVVPLRVVGGTDQGGKRPIAARLTAWRGALLMLGGTGIGAVAASVAAMAIFGSPFQNQAADQAAVAGQAAGAPALVAAASSAPAAAAGSASRVSAGSANKASATAVPGQGQADALAAATPPVIIVPPATGSAGHDTSDPDPVLPPAATTDRERLAAQSPDPGPDQPGQVGPTLGATRGAMGPFMQQGYGYSGAIGGAPATMGPGGAVPGTMQPMPGHLPVGPSLP
ncbi:MULTISPECIES: hypothetical protein [unclassified Novosphingobium]|uniref:hypothetical protein n=3 Tax=Novosphingobium TaxID=165696 RepID=UPI001441A1D3|nr:MULTISPECIES: hypothetical protein [unclassified Novosphingobium]MBB3359017.1 hypothetical protein [Novosphingobium sp. BK256]MBB3375502.1 hypothetical protein [Novosphingobium sp. BK280]MBB3379789.1 hypothetical protein [Novosphingobium sp. BK258]MBB3421484.1 hypothetical protein [Novosphingobium sp. BK267]MBB3449799.1 hypothetical protein [Novosphingobium sp. BK352]